MHSHVAVTVALVVLAISSIASAHDEYKALVSTGNVVPITLANSSALLSWTFSEQVSHTGWLVVMPGASVDEKAITGAARYLQYVAAVATVPEDSATVDLVDALGGPVKDEAYFRVFSFSRGLSTEHKSFTDIISARSFLLESAPPVYIPLNEENSQQFLSAAVMQHRIAILFFTESTKFHALAARLAYRFQEHTLVGVAAKPSESLLTSLKVDSVPQVRFMSAQMPKTAEDTAKGVQFQGAPYSDAQFGKANYANTVRWIKMVINAHNEVNFFAESAQSDSSHDQNEPQTPEQPTEFQSAETVVLNNEQIGSVCSETALGMCVIAFVSSDIDQYKLIMEKVRTSFSQSSRPLHFALVDLTCDYAPAKRVFGIEPDQSPALIVLSRSKGKMARFVGSFTADAIDGFLSRVHLGREAMMALSDARWLADGDLMSADACASLHGEIAALEAESAAAASSDDDEEYMTEKEKREKRAREEKEKKKKKKKKGNKKKKAKKTKKKTVEETEPKEDL